MDIGTTIWTYPDAFFPSLKRTNEGPIWLEAGWEVSGETRASSYLFPLHRCVWERDQPREFPQR